MGIINQMPSESGIKINGTEKDYYVYQGETIKSGDFVEVIEGIGEIRGAYNETPTTGLPDFYANSSYQYGHDDPDAYFSLGGEAAFAANIVYDASYKGDFQLHLLKYSETTNKLELVTTSSHVGLATTDPDDIAARKWYKMNEHLIVYYMRDDSFHYLTPIFISEDYTSFTVGATYSKSWTDEYSTDYFYGGLFIPLTDNSGILLNGYRYVYSYGNSTGVYMTYITFTESGNTSESWGSLKAKDGTSYNLSYFYGWTYGARISENQVICNYASTYYLCTFDLTAKTFVYEQLTVIGSTCGSYMLDHVFHGNKLICQNVLKGKNTAGGLMELDKENLTLTNIQSVSISNRSAWCYGFDNTILNIGTDGTLYSYEVLKDGIRVNEITHPCQITTGTYTILNYYDGKAITALNDGTAALINIITSEMQVKLATTQLNWGVAITEGTGGTEMQHNQQVKVIIPNTTE